tara:strand:+ start:2015 stop:2470 length:456 start_codon:yes stop_codon:yes gene_type:complete
MPVKSFKGLINDGGIETIALHTNNGSTGYKIKKLQLMPQEPGASSVEHVVKIFKISQSSAAGTVDFSNQTLVASAFMTIGSSAGTYGNAGFESIIFDNEIFNQDIFITHVDNGPNNKKCNYYIELETVKLALDENTVATLKDIRNIEGRIV